MSYIGRGAGGEISLGKVPGIAQPSFLSSLCPRHSTLYAETAGGVVYEECVRPCSSIRLASRISAKMRRRSLEG